MNESDLEFAKYYPKINLEIILSKIKKGNVRTYSNRVGSEGFNFSSLIDDINFIVLTKHVVYRYCERCLNYKSEDIDSFLNIHYEEIIAEIYRNLYSKKTKQIYKFFPDEYAGLTPYKNHLAKNGLYYNDHIFLRSGSFIFIIHKNKKKNIAITCYKTNKFEKKLNGIPIK